MKIKNFVERVIEESYSVYDMMVEEKKYLTVSLIMNFHHIVESYRNHVLSALKSTLCGQKETTLLSLQDFGIKKVVKMSRL